MSPESASRLIGPCCIVMRGGPEAPIAVAMTNSAAAAARSALQALSGIAAMYLRIQPDVLLAQPRNESARAQLLAAPVYRHLIVRRDDLRVRIDSQAVRRDAHRLGRARQQAGDCHIAAQIDLHALIDHASLVRTGLPELPGRIAELHLDLLEQRDPGRLLVDI